MHSTADIAKRLGCTTQAVNKYRRKVEKQDGVSLGTPDPEDGRRILFTDGEADRIAAMAPQIPVTEVDAELIDGEDTVEAAPVTASLALRHSTLPAVRIQTFDADSARQDITAIEAHTNRVAARADDLLSGFAQARMAQAMTNIDRTIATLEANALGDAAAMLGKPSDGSSA
jgi:hypothetical protein